MIIYGSRAVPLNSIQLPTATCPACSTQGSVVLSIYSRHAHIFWIPLFPIGKVGLSQCLHCKNAREAGEMSTEVRNEFEKLKRSTKTPVWQFAGLGLLALLIAVGSLSNIEDKKLQREYLAAPKEGDTYRYKTESGDYSLFKVTRVSDSTVFICPNQYSVDRLTGTYKIDKIENYSADTFGIAATRIKEMYDSGRIIDIKRYTTHTKSSQSK